MSQNFHIQELGPRVPLFALNGPTPGPRLVVTGPDRLVRALADQLWARPSLATLCGNVFVRDHSQDVTLDLPDCVLEVTGDIDQALEQTLDRMAELGMIPIDAKVAA
jgi:hypothetical protein